MTSLETLCCCFFATMCITVLSVRGLEVPGSVTMQDSSLPVQDMEAGSLIGFDFDIGIELEENVEELLVIMSGDTLVFPNETSVWWVLTDGEVDGVVYGCNQSFFMSANTSDPDTECPLEPGVTTSEEVLNGSKARWMLNVTTGLQPGNWTFNGSFVMEISEYLTQGSLVRAVMAVWIVGDGNDIQSKYIASNYVIITEVDVKVTTRSSLTQPILGILTTEVAVNTSRPSLSVVIGCLTPYENVSNEVMLTVQNMKVSISDTEGVHANTSELLEDLEATITSTIGSYQNNKAVLELEGIPRDADTEPSSMVVTTDFSVRVEDYSQLADGDVFALLISTKFQGNVILVSDISVTLDAPDVRKPSLEAAMSQIQQCPYDGNVPVTMTVLVQHDTRSSTATAYNVTLNIYVPPYVTMTGNSYSEPRENSITVVQEGGTIRAEIARLTFSDPFLMTLNLDLNLDNRNDLEASHRIVIAEALYNDRWANLTDMLTDTVYISLTVDKPCAKRIRWDKDGSCINDACPCPSGQAPGRCAPCGEMWRCTVYIRDPNFEKISKLAARKITCEASLRRGDGPRATSCYRELKNPTRFIEFSPRLGVITGQDTETGHYYGIANNGIAHVVSKDYGWTWSPIFGDEYANMTSSDSFKWVTFL